MPTDPWAEFRDSPSAEAPKAASAPDQWAEFRDPPAGGDWEGSANTAKQDPRWGVTDMKTLEENVMAPGRGVAKGLYNTFAGATRVLAPIPDRIGLGKVFPPLKDAPIEEGEATGNVVGQVLPYLVPGGAARGLAGAAVQGVKAAGIAKAQGHNPLVAGALGAAGPVAAKVLPMAGPLVKKAFSPEYRDITLQGAAGLVDLIGGTGGAASIGMGILRGTMRSRAIKAVMESGSRVGDEILGAIKSQDAAKVAAAIKKAAEKNPEVAEAVAEATAQAAKTARAAPTPTVASKGREWLGDAKGRSRIPTILTRPKTGKGPTVAPLTKRQRDLQLDQLRAAEEAGLDIFEVFGGATR